MSISREVLAKYVKPGCTFIETGTRWGTTCVRAFDLGAKHIYTCESDRLIAQIARMMLEDVAPHHAEVFKEDSVSYLRGIHFHGVGAIVFLDAHTESHSPILEELGAIATWNGPPSVILIDDMRLMEHWGYSTELIEKKVRSIGNYTFEREAGAFPEDILVCKLV